MPRLMAARNSTRPQQHPHFVSAFVQTAGPVSVFRCVLLEGRDFLRQSLSSGDQGVRVGLSQSSRIQAAIFPLELTARTCLQPSDRIPPICLSQGAHRQSSHFTHLSSRSQQSIRLRETQEETSPEGTLGAHTVSREESSVQATKLSLFTCPSLGSCPSPKLWEDWFCKQIRRASIPMGLGGGAPERGGGGGDTALG